ncbi:MAG: TonB-dependent receptor [Pyrinomonadaceae bacterium]|nr:TonB-dependent receptor [Pyrinomonadaceae bacterium]
MTFGNCKSKGLLAIFAVVLSIVLAGSATAQTGSATIQGTVTDQQGAVVAGATVKLVNESRGFNRTVVTSSSGAYSFSSVPPDTYQLTIEANGFKKLVQSSVSALVDKTTSIDAMLEPGAVSEVVNVAADGLESIVNTQDASLGNNFVSRQILQLPLQGRNVANLLSLQAAVTPDGSVAGGRADQANITLDGIDVNNQQNASAFESVLRVNPDSVDEFRVTTLNPDASKGRSSGAQISLITKSGSNDFRGALYEYHRNTATTANDWFNNRSGVERPKLIRNLFGGRLGGPIIKDRLFFFYNYEGMREAKGESVVRLVPTASLGQGNIKFFDNTGQAWTITTAQINTFTVSSLPVVDVNPIAASLFASAASRYPVNDSTVGDGLNSGGFRFNAATPIKQNAHTARFDWNVTKDQKHQLSFRGNYQQDITGAPSYFPDTPPTNTWSHPLGMALTHTWLINSNMTNRLSYGLTRIAFSNQGDSDAPAITFRYIFQPTGFARTFNRTNPTQNITDDFTWIKGNHSLQFGTNIRLIKNSRTNFARAFDNGITNPSAYPSNVARTAINNYITATAGSPRTISGTAWSTPAQGALVALLGRLSGYGANFNFDTQGQLIPANTGIFRQFKTEEYDFYFQDTWKLRSNLTLTAGVRYGLSMPVTETQGYETVPSIVLSTYLQNTIDAMNRGQNYREPLSVRKAGKANGLDSIYPLDKNNVQPRVSIAWSPEFEKGFLSKMFGKDSESVFRAGFAITNDYFGQQLATNWDGSNTLGFASSASINVNTYNITNNPAPLYTGPNMVIRNLPNLTIPTGLTFPQTAPFNNPGQGKIETSLDQNLVSPINYTWNVSYGRQLPGKIWLDVAYIGRLARNLLVGRDAMMLRDIRDPVSGMSYNEAGTILDRLLQAGAPLSSVPNLAFYNNMWAPGSLAAAFSLPAGTTNTQAVYLAQPSAGDWTYLMQQLDQFTGSRYFFQGQYDSLSAFSTVGKSDYHGATVSLRQRLAGTTWDLNYTYSKSLDEASGLQTGGLFGSAFVLNAFKLGDQKSYSDFDLRHQINFNGVWDIPVGKGRKLWNGMNKFADAVLGGWSLAAVFRWDSGYPFDGFYDATGWQTNWNIRSYMTNIRKVKSGTFYNSASSTCTSGCDIPNMFANPDDANAAFRTPHPGETGSRNPLRFSPSINLDASLSKSFDMPWREGHKVTFRWDVFNVANTPYFTGQSIGTLGYTGTAADGAFGRYTAMANSPRIMQFALRYDF